MDFDSIIKGLQNTGIFVVLILLIKSQLDQINSMKVSIDAMKTYIDMFKVDEFKKYAQMVGENAEHAATKNLLEIAPDLIREIIQEINEAKAGSPNP